MARRTARLASLMALCLRLFLAFWRALAAPVDGIARGSELSVAAHALRKIRPQAQRAEGGEVLSRGRRPTSRRTKSLSDLVTCEGKMNAAGMDGWHCRVSTKPTEKSEREPVGIPIVVNIQESK